MRKVACAIGERGNLRGVYIETDHARTTRVHRRREREADITKTDHADNNISRVDSCFKFLECIVHGLILVRSRLERLDKPVGIDPKRKFFDDPLPATLPKLCPLSWIVEELFKNIGERLRITAGHEFAAD